MATNLTIEAPNFEKIDEEAGEFTSSAINLLWQAVGLAVAIATGLVTAYVLAFILERTIGPTYGVTGPGARLSFARGPGAPLLVCYTSFPEAPMS